MPRSDGRPVARRRRNQSQLIIALAAIGVLALAGGYLLGSSGTEQASPSGSPAAAETPTDEPTPSQAGTETETQTETPEPTATTEPADLEDGKHFARVVQMIVPEQGPRRVEFDLAYFLTGEEAEEAAAEHGDEVLNGYYIVNDNPTLRQVPLAEDAEVSYVPQTVCCDLQPGDLDTWVDSMNGTVMSDYPEAGTSWWWLTVQDGQVVDIEHQWVP